MKVAIRRSRGLRFLIRIMGSRRLRRASSIMMATYGNMMVIISSKCLKRDRREDQSREVVGGENGRENQGKGDEQRGEEESDNGARTPDAERNLAEFMAMGGKEISICLTIIVI